MIKKSYFKYSKYIIGCDILKIEKKEIKIGLSKNDRKIIDKYTKTYSNFIESVSAKNEIYEEEKFKKRV